MTIRSRLPMRTRSLLRLATAACGVAVLAACSEDYPTLSLATPKERFAATLAPRAGVTATSRATAAVVFEDTNTIQYEVLGTGLTGVTRLQLQAGSATDTGTVMLTLFTAAAPTNVDSNRVVRQGQLTRSAVVPVAPFTFDSITRRIRAGSAFVVIRTAANPAGELRGQLTPVP